MAHFALRFVRALIVALVRHFFNPTARVREFAPAATLRAKIGTFQDEINLDWRVRGFFLDRLVRSSAAENSLQVARRDAV